MRTQNKKAGRILSLLLIFIAAVIFCGCSANTSGAEEGYRLIRIHIRADSNRPEAQAVKLDVKEAVTAYLNGELNGMTDFETAYRALENRLDAVKTIAERTLLVKGFGYGAAVRLNNEYFPVRAYEGVVVESGYYDALVIELGSGSGDNWWCVIYPPLCFIGSENTGEGFTYRSKIKELWESFTKNLS
ncbi:MAG: stage II sporulation protein R [Clostridiales bacterium]|jgi:stage II sporulation protein R|nr:stage II sporulation protein R [Clostridiales bacterium]